MALELLALGPAHTIQSELADHVTTGQKLRWVGTGCWLLGHGTDEDVVELEGGAKVHFAGQLSRSLEVLFDYTAQFGEFWDRVSARLNCPQQR